MWNTRRPRAVTPECNFFFQAKDGIRVYRVTGFQTCALPIYARVMAGILDEYSTRQGYTPAVVTGKPLSLGGSLGREEATGRGVMYVMAEYARDFGIPLKGSRVVIQGFGNVGGHLARLLDVEAGAKVIAVSDVEGGIVDENGLDVPGLLA